MDLEIKEIEDRDLLKDVKTSFIPSYRDLNYGRIEWDEHRSRRDITSTSIDSIVNNQDTSKNETQVICFLYFYVLFTPNFIYKLVATITFIA